MKRTLEDYSDALKAIHDAIVRQGSNLALGTKTWKTMSQVSGIPFSEQPEPTTKETATKTVTIDIDYFEYLLNCLANQKFINDINADALDADYKKMQREYQEAIDKAWLEGMDLLASNKPEQPEPTE